MPLAIFDLDNTLLAGDSDYLWGCYLVQQGLVDGAWYEHENERFYREYRAGTLDIRAFLRFALRPLREHPRALLESLRARFVEEMIAPLITPQAQALVERHRTTGDTLLIITATNAFVTAPIAARFGIEHLIATLPEERDGYYTGEVEGVPAFREGKVIRLEDWLAERRLDLKGSFFYSDSHNDLPLLERVDHPCAVNPDPQLQAIAAERAWPILWLRDDAPLSPAT
ncbi:HAD family hydrolase [Caldichromatium japonicum]|uniref:Histidinol-phosphatase n=1 Tax=Caldichromatium japonicum TaxID=2699430 RepID=A0A6G7VEE4_9GAMM|nr:HAD family hydrolase [Caldichromatium japonicum]QIK38391.1 HAD family hydrolase [Caldichromatium japonicum]